MPGSGASGRFGGKFGRIRARIWGRTCNSLRGRRPAAGNPEPEGSAMTGAALGLDRAAVLFEDAMADGEPES